jgi:hypothetical protein
MSIRRLKATLSAIRDTRLVAETFGIDELVEVQQIANLLAIALTECREILGTDPSQFFGKNVDVSLEWGHRYKVPGALHMSDVAPLTHEAALQMAADLEGYDGDVFVEIVRRPTMTGEWEAQDLQLLAERHKRSQS